MTKSARGKEISFEGMRAQNEKLVATGNGRMNARGDLLGKNGVILKTREEMALEYNTQVANPAVNIPVSQDTISNNESKETSILKPSTPIETKKSKIEKQKDA